jgi:hypothetical protein
MDVMLIKIGSLTQFALIYTFLVSIHGFHFREYSLLGLHTTSLHTQVCSKEADKLPKGTQLPKLQKFKDLLNSYVNNPIPHTTSN